MYNILAVDDQYEQLECITNIIESNDCPDYDLFIALNAVVALKIAGNEAIDLIITDWEMPEIDGIELIKRLKMNPATQHIPVIMCTGIMMSSENLKTALDSGAVDFIRKPIDEIELLARIRSMLMLSSSYARERQLNEAKNKILTIMAHDLKGPIGSMQFLFDLILSGELSGERLEYFLKAAKNTIGSAVGLLDNLLQWTKSQRGILRAEPVYCNLTKSINDCIALLYERVLEKSIRLSTNLQNSITVYCDENMVTTVIRNLVTNAIKFTNKEGEILITTTLEDGFAVVKVIDNGIGIPQNNLPKLFNSTYYVTSFGTMNEKGSGLGLKISKEFVEMNAGKIWAQSEENKGSTFCFTIPLNPEYGK